MNETGLIERIRRLRDDFPFWGRELGRIRPKDLTKGVQVPFALNGAQAVVWAAVERQLATRGYVRLRVLKGRQLGITTLFALLFYHRTSLWPGTRAFILSHREDTTAEIVRMIKRAHGALPDALRPAATADMTFTGIDSSLGCGTAAGSGVGVGQTIQLFLGDEVAKWTSAEEHALGLEQAIPFRGQGTFQVEISTSQGTGNTWHHMWQAAVRGDGDFEPVFVPWTLLDDYTISDDDEERGGQRRPFEPSDDWRDYAELHGLTRGQLRWAWLRNRDIAVKAMLSPDQITSGFRQEYPLTPEESFLGGAEECFISPETVLLSVQRKALATGAVVLGVDPGGGGADPTGMIDRDDQRAGFRVCEEIAFPPETYEMDLAGRVLSVMERIGAVHCFIEVSGGYGQGAYNRLVQLGYGDRVTLVKPGGRPQARNRAINRRAENIRRLKEWIVQSGQIVDHMGLRAQLSWLRGRYLDGERLKIEDKDMLRKRTGGLSPNIVDALAATFDTAVKLPARNRGAKVSAVTYDPMRW